MRTLALDMANKTGFAYGDDTGVLMSSTTCFGFIPEETLGAKLDRFRLWLETFTFDNIVLERAHQRGSAATRQALGMEAVVEMLCYRRAVPAPYFVHSRTLKKWATGNGNANKQDMLEAAKLRFPNIEIVDDNHADALLILKWWWE